jgi:hypothetical protein
VAKSKGMMPKYPPKPKKDGRPVILTQEIQDKIVAALNVGNYLETAAAFAGVHKDSVFAWMKRGRLEPDSIYSVFLSAVEKAQAFSEMRDVQVIDKAGQGGQWQASAWRLERKFSKRWGRTDRHEHTGKNGGPITFIDMVRQLEKDVNEEAPTEEEEGSTE